MTLACRFGLHDWEHLGYELTTGTAYDDAAHCHYVHRGCRKCGKRHRGGRITGIPPEVSLMDDGTYVDRSRRYE